MISFILGLIFVVGCISLAILGGYGVNKGCSKLPLKTLKLFRYIAIGIVYLVAAFILGMCLAVLIAGLTCLGDWIKGLV